MIYLSVITPKKYIKSKYSIIEDYLKFENEIKYLQKGISFRLYFDLEEMPNIEIIIGEIENVQSVEYFHN